MTGPTRPRRPSLAEIARGNSMFAPLAMTPCRAAIDARESSRGVASDPPDVASSREAAASKAEARLAEHREASKRRLVERLADELAAVDPERWTAEIDRLDRRYRRACRARWPDLTEDRLEESSARLWSAVLERLDAMMDGQRRQVGAA